MVLVLSQVHHIAFWGALKRFFVRILLHSALANLIGYQPDYSYHFGANSDKSARKNIPTNVMILTASQQVNVFESDSFHQRIVVFIQTCAKI